MAYEIKNITFKPGQRIVDLYFNLSSIISKSRFTCRIENKLNKLTFHDIRLLASKEYCGNHPEECKGPERTERKMRFLEGADWVAFNDMVNDVLDDMCVSANVASSICAIRIGYERCVDYSSSPNYINQNSRWARYGRYEDFCGQPHPKAKYPEGTPGIDTYLAEQPAKIEPLVMLAGNELS